jgi:hypothetical protein
MKRPKQRWNSQFRTRKHSEAPEKQEWRDAIKTELKALRDKKTFTMVKRDPSMKVIGCKWVIAIKRDENGKIQRYKARLVALGYRQTEGIDYNVTYSPVANMNSIRTFLAMCCQHGYYIMQYDVDTAFLNGKLEEDMDTDEEMFRGSPDEEEKDEERLSVPAPVPVPVPVSAPEPAFDIDDVYMEDQPDLDSGSNELVPRERFDEEFDQSTVFGPSSTRALPPSENSQALVPVELLGVGSSRSI